MTLYMLAQLQTATVMKAARTTNQKLTLADIEEVKSDLLVDAAFDYRHLTVFAAVFETEICLRLFPVGGGVVMKIVPPTCTRRLHIHRAAATASAAAAKKYVYRFSSADEVEAEESLAAAVPQPQHHGLEIQIYRYNKVLRAASAYKVDALKNMFVALAAAAAAAPETQQPTTKAQIYDAVVSQLALLVSEFIQR